MDQVAVMEAKFLPLLQQLKLQVATEYPEFNFKVWSSSIGSATELQGHTLGLECMFPDASNQESNCLSIEIGVKHLTTVPMIYDSSVAWGSGDHPEISIELIDQPLPFTSESFEKVSQLFPNLASTFRTALHSWVHRGRPNP
jgi:hypothetical protein